MKDTIVTGALLHDIGKLIYRGLKESEFSRNYRHQELGAHWAAKENLSGEIISIIKRHHRLKNNDEKYKELSVDSYSGENTTLHNILRTVDMADNLAAGMERTHFDRSKGSFDRAAGLKSIFSNVTLHPEQAVTNTAIKTWEPQNIIDYPYPEMLEQKIRAKQAAFYTKQWESFCDEFHLLKQNINEDILLTLLQKYTMMIPEHTLVTEAGPPDTSLYHHTKSTAAIAWCIYKYLIEEISQDWNSKDLSKNIYQADDDKFLLIAGDFSGIQKFIYTITSKAALKTVRARSFYLELLAECVISHLVEELDLCRSCIVYSSGGGFYLLAPNTGQVKQKLNDFSKAFNRYLLDEFGFTLYLCVASSPLSGKDLKGGKDEEISRLGNIWSNLKRDLGEEKGKKWLDIFEEEFNCIFDPKDEIEDCVICHQPAAGKKDIDEEKLSLCSFCANMVELGKLLPDLNCFYEVNKDSASDFVFNLNIFDHTYSFVSQEKSENIKCKYLVKKLWDLSGCNYPVRNLPMGSYFAIKNFNELAKTATGLKKLGTLRMDVDFLGRIFSRGLGKNNTFARLNDLSERLNLYFKYYLPAGLEKWIDSNLSRVPRETRERLMVNLVYAGGDDLFLVGTWDSALDAANFIYADFRRYTGYNSDITLSGGLAITDEKVAFYRMAEAAGIEEKRAKSNDRDSFSIFGNPLKWHEVSNPFNVHRKDITLEDLLNILTSGVEYKGTKGEPKAFSKSFLQNLLNIIIYYLRPLSNQTDERYWVFPQLHYFMARAMKSQKGKEYKNVFYRPLFSMMLNEKVLEKQMIPALQIVDYLTRGENE